MLSDHAGVATGLDRGRLNAPCGARCFLTDFPWDQYMDLVNSLNAPYGAWCFLTGRVRLLRRLRTICRLNAPFGARCFLTCMASCKGRCSRQVLMRLLVLGAFWPSPPKIARLETLSRLNAPFGARRFLTRYLRPPSHNGPVLMHRLALGAF